MVLGSMFMQAFAVEYNFASENRIILRGSKWFTLPGAYVQDDALGGANVSPFMAAGVSSLPVYIND
jgi:glutaredoxin-related protein